MMIDIIIIFILMVTVSYRPLHLSHDVHDGASEMHSVDDYIEELYEDWENVPTLGVTTLSFQWRHSISVMVTSC